MLELAPDRIAGIAGHERKRTVVGADLVAIDEALDLPLVDVVGKVLLAFFQTVISRAEKQADAAQIWHGLETTYGRLLHWCALRHGEQLRIGLEVVRFQKVDEKRFLELAVHPFRFVDTVSSLHRLNNAREVRRIEAAETALLVDKSGIRRSGFDATRRGAPFLEFRRFAEDPAQPQSIKNGVAGQPVFHGLFHELLFVHKHHPVLFAFGDAIK